MNARQQLARRMELEANERLFYSLQSVMWHVGCALLFFLAYLVIEEGFGALIWRPVITTVAWLAVYIMVLFKNVANHEELHGPNQSAR